MKFLKKVFKRRTTWLIFGVIIAFIYFNNSSLLAQKRESQPFFLAHRGVAQTFTMKDIQNDTCTAERIYKPEHNFLENG